MIETERPPLAGAALSEIVQAAKLDPRKSNPKSVGSLYRRRPLVAELVRAALFRWPAPRTEEPQPEVKAGAPHG